MTNTGNINSAIIQQRCTAESESNIETAIAGIRIAADQGAQLIVLPELHNHLYFCQTENTQHFKLAEAIPGPACVPYSRLAAELGVVLVASFFEKRTADIYHNTAVVFDSNGDIVGKYRKMHIPDGPGYYEKFYFTPGDMGFKPIQTSLGKIGVLVCWDQWFPEAARLMTLAGADVLVYPTAIGWDPDDAADEKQRQLDAWQMVQRSHAIANGLPVICCNRTGFEADPSGQSAGINFWGNSFIAGPQGELLAQLDADAEPGHAGVLMAELTLSRSEEVRKIWPYLQDRRIDAYNDLTRRWPDEE